MVTPAVGETWVNLHGYTAHVVYVHNRRVAYIFRTTPERQGALMAENAATFTRHYRRSP